MANTFKRALVSGTVADQTLYTVPASTTTVVIGITISNTTDILVYIDLKVGTKYILNDVPLPVGSTLGALDGKLVLEAADTLVGASSVAAGADFIVSYMEMT